MNVGLSPLCYDHLIVVTDMFPPRVWRNVSSVAIWDPNNRGEEQLKCQLVWARCQASRGYVWWGCFPAKFWEGTWCLFKGWHLLRQTGRHSATEPDWDWNSALHPMLKQCRALRNIFRSVGFPGSWVWVGAEANSRSCFCVNKSVAPALMRHWTTEGSMGPLSQCHPL